MTAPTKAAKATPAKSAEPATPPASVPSVESRNPFDPNSNKIMFEAVKGYLDAVTQINKFNEPFVQAEVVESDNTPNKLLRKAKEAARPEDKNVQPDNQAESLISQYESALEAVQSAKLAAAKYMADKLGVTMAKEVAKPDPDEVKNIQDKVRAPAAEMLKTLALLGNVSGDKTAKEQIEKFIAENPLPMVGRGGSWSPGADGASGGTPKYRVSITAKRGDEVLWVENGITSAVLRARKNHAKDKTPGPDVFRKAYEAKPANETSVDFAHDGVTYVVAARPTAK